MYPLYTDSPYKFTEGKVIYASRLGMKTPPGTMITTAPLGVMPATWTDVGSIDQSLVTLDKADSTITDVTTGLYEVLRAQIAQKDGNMTGKLNLVEYEPAAWAALTGDITHTVGTGTSIYIGGRPIVNRAILLIGENNVTGKELVHFNPSSNFSWKIVDLNRFSVIEVTIHFLKFTDAADTTGGTVPGPTGIGRDFLLALF